MSTGAGPIEVKPIHFPSGDQNGQKLVAPELVRRCAPDPSEFIAHIWPPPDSVET